MSAPDPAARRHTVRLIGSELRLIFTRRRNLAILTVLAAIPVLIAVAVRISHRGGGGSIFGGITDNGIFVGFAALFAVVPVFLPMAMSVVAGDSIAGEASSGTLRYLLTVPVSRLRLLVTKFLAALVWSLACALVVVVAGVLAGLALFPAGRVTLLSGTSTSYVAALWLLLVAALYAGAMMASIAAIGLLVSTLTEVPIAAMAATMGAAIASTVMDAVPQLQAIAPALPTHRWLAFADLLRDPVVWDRMGRGLLVTLTYVAIAGTLAWARFSAKDITS